MLMTVSPADLLMSGDDGYTAETKVGTSLAKEYKPKEPIQSSKIQHAVVSVDGAHPNYISDLYVS
jgi:hypothetical protein